MSASGRRRQGRVPLWAGQTDLEDTSFPYQEKEQRYAYGTSEAAICAGTETLRESRSASALAGKYRAIGKSFTNSTR